MANIRRTIYRAMFCNKHGSPVYVDFNKLMADTLPIPEIKLVNLAGVNDIPVEGSYKEDSEYKMTRINGSEYSFKLIGGENTGFSLKSLFTQNETEWQVNVYGAWKWQGFVVPDGCSEPFVGASYEVLVRATDRIGVLKDVPYSNLGKAYKGFESDLTVLQRSLKMTGLDIDTVVSVNTTEEGMQSQSYGVDPLKQTFIDQAAFYSSDGVPFSCEYVIESILSRWSARLHQFNGKWQVVNVLEKSKGAVVSRVFDPTGNIIEVVNLGDSVLAGGSGKDVIVTGSSMTSKALSQSTAYYLYGYPSNKLINGDFNTEWPSPLLAPPGWTKSGDILINRQVSEADPSDIYASLNITNITDQPGAMLSTPIQVRAGEVVTFSMDLYSPESVLLNSANVLISAYDEENNFFKNNGWSAGGGWYSINKKGKDFLNQMSISFVIDAREADYKLTIGLTAIQNGGFNRRWLRARVNNVSLRPSVENKATRIALGEYTINKTLTDQTYVKDPITIIHSDDQSDQRVSGIRINNDPNTDRLLAWTRAGYVEKISLLTTISNTEITVHQVPYITADWEFYGDGEVDINTLLSVDHDDLPRAMIFLSGAFDVMGGRHKLRFAEVLTDKMNADNLLGFGLHLADYGDLKDKSGSPVASPGSGSSPGGSVIDTNAFIANQSAYQTDAKFNVSIGIIKDKLIVPGVVPDEIAAGQSAFWIGNLSGLENIPGGYVLPAATTTTLGGVIVGPGLSIDSSGRLSSTGGESPLTFTFPLVRTLNNVTLQEGATLNNNISGTAVAATYAERWGNGLADFTTFGTSIQAFAAFDGPTGKTKHFGVPETQSALGIDNGSTLANNISGTAAAANNSALWNGQVWGGTFVGGGINGFIVQNTTTGANQYASITNAQNALGLGSFAYKNFLYGSQVETSVGELNKDIGVAQMLRWKNYGNGHVIFDASNGTSPSGTVVDNANSVQPWNAAYPTLMGWNGGGTYGVRVDACRQADGSHQWNGLARTAEGITVPGYVMTMNTDGSNAGYTSKGNLQNWLNVTQGGETLKSVTGRYNKTNLSIISSDELPGGVEAFISYGDNAIMGALSNHDLQIFAGAGEKARLFKNGNFGLGYTTDQERKLAVNGDILSAGSGGYYLTNGSNWNINTDAVGFNISETNVASHFHIDRASGNTTILGKVTAPKFISTSEGFKSNNFRGLVGDYNENSSADKIIWTIGDNWNTIEAMYGLGYQYNTKYGAAHSIVFRQAGLVTAAIDLGGGSMYLDGNLTASRATAVVVKATNKLSLPTQAPTTIDAGEACMWIGNLSGISN